MTHRPTSSSFLSLHKRDRTIIIGHVSRFSHARTPRSNRSFAFNATQWSTKPPLQRPRHGSTSQRFISPVTDDSSSDEEQRTSIRDNDDEIRFDDYRWPTTIDSSARTRTANTSTVVQYPPASIETQGLTLWRWSRRSDWIWWFGYIYPLTEILAVLVLSFLPSE